MITEHRIVRKITSQLYAQFYYEFNISRKVTFQMSYQYVLKAFLCFDDNIDIIARMFLNTIYVSSIDVIKYHLCFKSIFMF